MKNSIWVLWFAVAAHAAAGKPPLYFEPAGKQWVAHAPGGDLVVSETGAVAEPGGYRLEFPGARPAPAVASEPLPGKVNRFLGRDPRQWQRGISTFGRVRFPNLYPGIDLIYYGRDGELECDFIVAPYADPRAIALAFSPGPVLTPAGDLEAGNLRLRHPRVFQRVDGHEREIAGGFALDGPRARFHLAAYDRGRPLVIDPVVQFSTYLGGPADPPIQSIGADAAGNLYLAGPARTAQPGGAIYAAKLDPSGSTMLYATYIGGKNARDVVRGLAVDAQGNAFLAGSTNSPDFPLVKPMQAALKGGGDAFLLELDPTGAHILYSTYLGGSAADDAVAVALDLQGNAYVTGRTESINFPTTLRVLSRNLNGAVGSFVTKIKPDGSAPIYSTYLGGSSYDVASAIAVDAAGDAFVLAFAASADFPGLRAPAATFAGATVIAKLNPAASAVVYTVSTGTDNVANALAVDAAGNAWIAGATTSVHIPVTAGAVQRTPGGDVYFRSTDGGRTFTPDRRSINTGAVNGLKNSPAALGTLYAATADGIFRSPDDGATWNAVTSGGGARAVNAVAVDPVTPTTVYAAPAAGISIVKSIDGGATWNAASDDLDDDLGIACLAIDPNSPATVYAGGEGVLKSGDGGQSWGPAALLPSPVTSLAIDPSNSAIVYAGTSPDPNNNSSGPGGLFVSTDFGRTFNPTTIAADSIGAVLPDPGTPGTVYAAGAKALYKSTDSGATWTALTSGTPADFHALAFDPADPTALYACLGNGQVYRSRDGGATLTLTDSGFQAAGVTACLFSQNSVMHIGAVRGSDAFVMKLDTAGVVRYATYFGGQLNDSAAAMAVDASGNAYIAGTTASPDFPVAKAMQAKLAGGSNAFLAEFDPSGALLFSTFWGGTGSDGAAALALAGNGTVYVAGATNSRDFPLVNAMQGSSVPGGQQFVIAFQ